MSPRQSFIEQFSVLAGVDSDTVTELVGEIDAIHGVCSFFNGELLSFSFFLDRDECSFLHLNIECGTPKMFFNPFRIKRFLLSHGRFPFEAEDMLSELSQFLTSQTDTFDEDKDYFLNIDDVIESTDQVILSISKFICAIS